MKASQLLKGTSPLVLLGMLLLLLLIAGPAYASEASTGMEWETPIQAIVRSITGPYAFAISFLGIVVCGATLIWGGEVNEFVRRFLILILVVSILMFAGPILRRMFSGGASLITAPVATAPAADVVQLP